MAKRMAVCAALAASCVACAGARAGDAAAAAAASAARAASYKVLRGAEGRLSVVGRDSGTNLMIVRWVEDVMTRLERFTGLDLPFDRDRPFAVLVLERPSDSAARNEGGGFKVDVPGWRVVVHLPWTHRGLEDDAALCGALLDAWVAGARGDAPPWDELRPEGSRVPRWFALGLTQALLPETRADGIDAVLWRWWNGTLPTLPSFLASPPTAADAADGCIGVGLALWIGNSPRRQDIFRALWAAWATDTADVTWWAARMAGGDSPVGLDEAWEEWLLEQARTVRSPGKTTELDARRLIDGLLIYPSLYGIPFGRTPYRPVPWRDLIARRHEPWALDFCRRKSAALRVLGAGRGDGPERVIDAYGAFLNALAAGHNPGLLGELLDQAETERAKFAQAWTERLGNEKLTTDQ